MKKLFSILLVVAVVVVAAIAQAQQPTKVPRIGYLGRCFPFASPTAREAFRQGLRELGYVEGKNIIIEWRSARGKVGPSTWPRGRAGSSQGRRHRHGWFEQQPARPSKQLSTIPIVMAQDADPVGNGIRRQPCATWRKHYRTVQPLPRS